MTRSRRSQAGRSILEFTLVGIPLIFVLISFFELARGMWTYHTLAYAVREGTRYSAFRGRGCASPNTCQVTIGQTSAVIRSAGPGLDPALVTLTFSPASGTVVRGTMQSLLTNTATWPPSTSNAVGQNIQISAAYPFNSVLAVVWPGSGRAFSSIRVVWLGASSQEGVQF
jgi:Flp pilus assembly protein TadG